MIYDDKNTMTRRDVIRGTGAVTIASRYGRAAEYPSFWTEPSWVRSEQAPAPLNKILRLQRRLSLHIVTRHRRPMIFPNRRVRLES
jgi:hypothetical protein